MSTERDELAAVVNGADWTSRSQSIADALLAAGYRKPQQVTEYGIAFNRSAVFLKPPAHSLDEFKERYPREHGWILTDRDIYLVRTYMRVDPEASPATVLHVGGAE